MYGDYAAELAGVPVPANMQGLVSSLIDVLGGCNPLTHRDTLTISPNWDNRDGVTQGALNVNNYNVTGSGYAIKTSGTVYVSPGVNNDSITALDQDGNTIFNVGGGPPGGRRPPGGGPRGFVFVGGPMVIPRGPVFLGPSYTPGSQPAYSGNLLSNPGFEEGTDGESPPTGWSGGGTLDNPSGIVTPAAGNGVGITSATTMYQEFDVTLWKDAIDAGQAQVRIKAACYYNPDGGIAVPAVSAVYLLSNNTEQSDNMTADDTYLKRYKSFWRYYDATFDIPVGTRKLTIRVTRSGGANYIDECYLGLQPTAETDDPAGIMVGGDADFMGDVNVGGAFNLASTGSFTMNDDLAIQVQRLSYLSNA